MKKSLDGEQVTLEEKLPEFSIDMQDLENLKALLSKWGFTGEFKDAVLENESISGSFDEVSRILSSKAKSIRRPNLLFKREGENLAADSVWIFSPWFEELRVKDSRVIIRLPAAREKEGLEIIDAIHGFALRKSKELKSDEEPGFLYFESGNRVEYRKQVPKPTPDTAKILRNTIESKLRKLVRNEPENEREIQNAVEDILVVKEYEYHRETERIPSGTRSTIPDFTIDNTDTAVEVKLCKTPEDERRILEEINADISTYQTRYSKVIFVVYDIGVIRDIDRFGRDILSHEGVYLTVTKH